MGLAAGQRLSFYELVGPLGAGGMGEVWRARDTRLGREVALKVLPERFTSDEERLRRFEREARTLAALQHPNIATIFGIDQVGDTCFIAMELVAGEDLAARLARGPLPVPEAIDVCRQIAEGLEAAHEAGVVHRDLKPANVRLRAGGAVKLLDFGLAKPFGSRAGEPHAGSSTPDSVLVSEEGLVLGTPTYMSPEQARGKPVDRRTDVWSFGCVLYECLTGRRAFEGETVSDVIAAVLDKEPDQARLPAATPARVRSLLARCFDKDPRQRLRDVGEARVALERSGDEPAPPKARGRGVLAFAAVSLALGAAVGWLARVPGDGGPRSGVRSLAFRQVSDLPGAERRPSLAPDGRSVVYVSEGDGGDEDLFLQRVEGRNPLNLTADSASDDSAPAFSPDGESIAFRSERGGGGIFVMGATGESVRRVTDFGYDPAWSPDGTKLAVTTEPVHDPLSRQLRSELWIVALDGGEKRRLLEEDAVGARWSPDGRRIAYWACRASDWQRDVFTIAADGSEESGTPVTDDAAVDWSPAWTPDGRALYFGSNRGGTMNLWRIALDPATGRAGGAPAPVTAPAGWSGDLTLSRDGRRVLYTTKEERTEISTVGFDPEAGALAGSPKRVFGGRALTDVDWSPDGERLVLVQRSEPWESIAVISADGSGYARITDASVQHRRPRWCPRAGSERILFHSNEFLATVLSDGSALRMTDARSDSATWSTDGEKIVVQTYDERWAPAGLAQYGIDPDGVAIRLDWSAQELSAARLTSMEDWSPDGKRVLASSGDDPGFFVIDLEHGTRRKLLDAYEPETLQAAAWLPDGKRFLIKVVNRILLVDADTGAATPVHEIERDSGTPWGRALSLSRDGRTLAFLERQEEGDVWMMELEESAD